MKTHERPKPDIVLMEIAPKDKNNDPKLAADRNALADLRDRFARETDPAKLSELSDDIAAIAGRYCDPLGGLAPDDPSLEAVRAARRAGG